MAWRMNVVELSRGLTSVLGAALVLGAVLLSGAVHPAVIDASARQARVVSPEFLELFKKEPWLNSVLPEPVSTWREGHEQQLICEWQTLPAGQPDMLLPRTMKVRIRFFANDVQFFETSEKFLAGKKAAMARATSSLDLPLNLGGNRLACEVSAGYETDGDYIVDPDPANNRAELQVIAADQRFHPLFPEEMPDLVVEAVPEGSRFERGASRTVNLGVVHGYRRAMSTPEFINRSGGKYVVETQVYWLAGGGSQHIGRINTPLQDPVVGTPHYTVTHGWLVERQGGPGRYRLQNRLLQGSATQAQYGPSVVTEIEFLSPDFKTDKGGVTAGSAPPPAGAGALLPDVAIVPAFELAKRSANWDEAALHVPGAATSWDDKTGLCRAELGYSLANLGAMDAGEYFIYVQHAGSDPYPEEVISKLARGERRELSAQVLLAPGENTIRMHAQNRTDIRESNENNNRAAKRVVLDGHCGEAVAGDQGTALEEPPPGIEALPHQAVATAPPNPCGLEVSYYVPEAPVIRAGDAGVQAGDQVEIECRFRRESRTVEWAQCDAAAKRAMARVAAAQQSNGRYSGIVAIDGNTVGVGSSPTDGAEFTRTQLWSFKEPGAHEVRCQTDNALRFAARGAAKYLDNGVSVDVAARSSARSYRRFDAATAVAVGAAAVPSAAQPQFGEGRVRLSEPAVSSGGRTGFVIQDSIPISDLPSPVVPEETDKNEGVRQ